MRIKEKIIAWLKLARVFFYPFNWVIYNIGVAVAYTTSQRFDLGVYVLGYICLFLVELGTAFINDYFDYPTDRVNKNAGTFNGGSRVLVEGKLGFNEVKAGIFVLLCLIPVFGYLLIQTAKDVSAFSILFLLLFGMFLGWGYTAPPLKFSYRGWGIGETVSSFSGGPLVIFFGYFLQTGIWTNPLPWLLSLPLFLATFGSALLPEIPDYHADFSVSRMTIPVIFGPRWAVILSICFNSLAAMTGLVLWYLKIITGPIGIALFVVIPHALVLCRALFKLIKTDDYDRKMDDILQLGLSYMFWFALIPLLSLIWR